MNQDFALLATPANARRLKLFSHILPIDLSPAIVALAGQDCLEEQAFDSPVKQTVAQFLLDCGLRGTVQPAYHPEINPSALLFVVQMAAPKVVVISMRRHVWLRAASALGMSIQVGTLSWLEQNLDQTDRSTVIIIETDEHEISSHHLRNVTREFPRTIIYDISELARLIPWVIWGQLLFPEMPHPLFPRLIQEVPPAWKTIPMAAFAVFYNVALCPHLVDSSITAALDDHYLQQRLVYHSSLLH